MNRKKMFEHIKVTFPEFNYYQQLNSKDKFLYVTELYELEKNKQDVNIEDVLNNFFNEHNSIDSEKKVDFDSFNVGNHKEEHRVDVILDNENVVIESNSLKAVRHIAYKFMDSGYVLSRDKNVEKMFKLDKITRYLRVYRIIGQTFHLCYN
jgi:hypothetical protein